MVQDSYQHTSKSSRDRPRTAPSAFRALQGGTQEAKILQIPCVFSMCFASSYFRVRSALEASRWLQYGPREPAPRGAQEGSKTAPRAPRTAPRAAQEGLKRLIFGSRRGYRVKVPPPSLIDSPKRAFNASKMVPRGPQERPKRAPRKHQEGPRGLQDGPKRAPKASKRAPRAPQ